MAAMWRIELLGGLRLRQEDRVITRFMSQKAGSLLAYLAHYRERSHSREVLAEMFWPESDVDASRLSLRVALNSLKRQLEPPDSPAGAILQAHRTHVQLNPLAIETDVSEFEEALRLAAAESGEARLQRLEHAQTLYYGELLPGYYEDWIGPERDRLNQSFVLLLRQLADVARQAGDMSGAIQIARRSVGVLPWEEEPRLLLIRLDLEAGRPADALRDYAEWEHLLLDEVNDRPSAAMRELVAGLSGHASVEPADHVTRSRPRQQLTPGSPPPDVPPARLETARVRLPVQLTRFFGRETEIARVLALLNRSDHEAAVRCVTLTGPGGSGKTRLAIEIAACLADQWSGPVVFVPLADVPDPGRIHDAIAAALGLTSASVDPLEQVVTMLGDCNAMLVLDNLEHLIANGEAQDPDGTCVIATLLSRVPTLICLVTSQQRLSLAGEQEYPVAPLPVPEQAESPARLLDFASVRLFVDRAQAARPDFQITLRNAAAIAAICRQLEGIPLAIELAAAWTQMLTPAQILTRLADRFELLVNRRRDRPARHQTLRATFAWSLQRLDPQLRRFFAGLSVFRGGWTLESAEAVCLEADEPSSSWRALTWLTELRERSLIIAEDQGETMRYRMLEAIREYAGEQLSVAERVALERRHILYYLQMVVSRDDGMQKEYLERLAAQHDNLHAALEYVPEESGLLGLRLAGALWTYWSQRSHLTLGRAHLTRALARNTAQLPTPERAHALYACGGLAFCQTDLPAALARFEECLALYRSLDDSAGIAKTLNGLGLISAQHGDLTAAERYYHEALQIHRQEDNWVEIGAVLTNLGIVAFDRGNYEAARALNAEALALTRTLNDTIGIALALHNLSLALLRLDRMAEALAVAEECLQIRRELGVPQSIAYVLLNLASVQFRIGDTDSARSYGSEGLMILIELQDRRGIAYALEGLAAVEVNQGKPDVGARLWGASEALREAADIPLPALEQETYSRPMADARATLGDAAFAAAWSAGRAMSLEQAIDVALYRH